MGKFFSLAYRGSRAVAVPADPPIISYAGGTQVLAIGVAITPIDPTVDPASGPITSYSCLPNPSTLGLAFSTVTGRISGTPTIVSGGVVNFVVTASGPGGSDDITVPINTGYAPALDYPGIPVAIVEGDGVSWDPDDPATNPTYSISAGALPAGLSLNTSTGLISGTAGIGQTGSFSVTIGVTNLWGSDSFVVAFDLDSVWAAPYSVLAKEVELIVGYSSLFKDTAKTQPVTADGDVVKCVENVGTFGSEFDLKETAAADSMNPTYVADGGDGRPAIRFGGNSGSKLSAELKTAVAAADKHGALDPYTVVVVYRLVEGTDSVWTGGYNRQMKILSLEDGTGGTYAVNVTAGANAKTSNPYERPMIGTLQDNIIGGADQWTAYDEGTIHVLIGHGHDAGQQEWYLDGYLLKAGTVSYTFDKFKSLRVGRAIAPASAVGPVVFDLLAAMVYDGWDEADKDEIMRRVRVAFPDIANTKHTLRIDEYAAWHFEEPGDGDDRIDEVAARVAYPNGSGILASTVGKSGAGIKSLDAGSGAGTQLLHAFPTFSRSERLYVAYWVRQKASTGDDGRGHWSIRNDNGACFTVRQQDGARTLSSLSRNSMTGPADGELITTAQVATYPGWSLVEFKYDPIALKFGLAVDGGAWEELAFNLETPSGDNPLLYWGYGQLGGGGLSQVLLDEFYIRKGTIPTDVERALLYNGGAGQFWPFLALPPAGLDYDIDYVSSAENAVFPAMTPSIISGEVTTYEISPALPTGLTINSGTGVISGTPTVPSGLTTYTITATGPGGTDTTTVQIEVYPPWNDGDPGDGGF